jgi:hydroxymethylbilane synthase
LRQFRPDLQIIEIRGNVDTRLRKVAEGEYDAIVLAKAGIDRLGYTSRITEILDPEIVLPAVGQGALGVEFLESRENDLVAVEKLVDADTMWAVQAERALLKKVQGGCRLPLGAWARFEAARMVIDSCVLAADGSESIRRRAGALVKSTRDAEALGDRVADELLGAGADRLLQMAGRSVGQA